MPQGFRIFVNEPFAKCVKARVKNHLDSPVAKRRPDR